MGRRGDTIAVQKKKKFIINKHTNKLRKKLLQK
jgi:hypothetical protein